MPHELAGTRRLMETSEADTVNQYLRFGWKLVNQHVIEATVDSPARMKYVLASVRDLEDSRYLLTLEDTATVNQHLALGWKLIETFVTAAEGEQRDERVHFVVAWQTEEPPVTPGSAASVSAGGSALSGGGAAHAEGAIELEGR